MRETLTRWYFGPPMPQLPRKASEQTRVGLRTWRFVLGALLCVGLAIGLAACGRSSDNGAPGAAPRVIPTMPAARFAQPTTMIGAGAPSATDVATDEDVADEDATDEETAAENGEDAAAAETPTAPQTLTPAAVTVDLARGETLYQARGCQECHGERGEGVPGEGSALAGLTLSESEFASILRTGGSGRLGSGHLYGPSAISPGGMSALYAWLQSLDEE